MFDRVRQIRPEERRDTVVASITLFALMAAHALLETARDALFLASIPASRLPFVYIGVAFAALGVAALQDRGRGGTKGLAAWLLFSAVVTLGFWPLVGAGDWVFYAIYIWSSVVVTVALARFFILLGSRFTVSQAKRLYALIGAGSVVGAIAGSGAAGLLAAVLPPGHLLVAAAGALAVSAMGPLLLNVEPASRSGDSSENTASLRSHASNVVANPYARRVATALVLATVVFTLADYVFKAEVAARVSSDQLGLFFGRVYFGLNILSLVVQVFAVRFLLRVCGPTGALAILPGLLALGGLGISLIGGVGAAVALKAFDGGLRHSLHRTASELLFVPMSSRLRHSAKTFIDLAGHRSAQAITSVAILAAVGIGIGTATLGFAIFALASLGVVLCFDLRRHYLDVFRETLADAAERPAVNFPELTLGTLESLLAALNSPDEQRVRVALQIFAEQDRAHLIPGLILYHPSPVVLAEALTILASTGRTDFIPLSDRLLDHEYADVRAAALRARMAIAPDEELLRSKVEVSCPVVRATALVGLAAGGYATSEETRPFLDEVLEKGSDVAKEALARAIGYGPVDTFEDTLIELAEGHDKTVLLSVARTMGKSPSPRFAPSLIRMLALRDVRPVARTTLVKIGEPALKSLAESLADEDESILVRRQLPHTIAKFKPEVALPILQTCLVQVQSGRVHYKVLRALGRLVADNPQLPTDRARLEQALGFALRRAFTYIDARLVIARGAEQDPARRTVANEMLLQMLADKESNTIERIFRLLGILSPGHGVETIFRGLNMPDPNVRASSRELLESFVVPRYRVALLALVDDVSDSERLFAASSLHQPTSDDYDTLVRRLAWSDSRSLRPLARYHLNELSLPDSAPEAPEAQPSAERRVRAALQQSPDWFSRPEPEGAA